MGDSDNTQHVWATVEALKTLDTKVDAIAKDQTEMRGWLEGTVSTTGERHPGLIDTVTSLKRDSSAAKWLLRLILAAIIAALASEWIFYLSPRAMPHIH